MPRIKPMEQFFSYVIGLAVAAAVVGAIMTTFYLTSAQWQIDQTANLSVAELKKIVRNIDVNGLPADGPGKNRLLAAILQLGNGDSEMKERVAALSLQQVHLQNEVGAAARISLEKLGPKAFPALREMLDSDDGMTLGRSCSSIYLLGPMASPFVPRLIEMIESGDELNVAAGLLALENMGEHALPALEAMDAIILNASFQRQISIAKICIGLKQDAAPLAEKLAEVLQKGLPSSATWAGIALGAIGPVEDVDTVKLLTARITDPRQVYKERALLGLALMGVEAEAAREQVKLAMTDPKSRVRPQAAYAYSKITEEAELPAQVLGSLLEKQSLRVDALHFLSKMGPAGAAAMDRVVPLLKSDQVQERESAVIALGSFGPQAVGAKNSLLALGADPDPLVREAVKVAVASIEQPQPAVEQ